MSATMQTIIKSLRESRSDEIEQMAGSLSSRVYLGDEAMVIKALSEAGWRCSEFYPFLDDITERARAIHASERRFALPAFVLMTVGIAAAFSFLTPDCAQAAEVAQQAPSNTPMHIAIAVLVAFVIFAWVIVWGIDRIKVGHSDPEYRDDRDALARDREGGVL